MHDIREPRGFGILPSPKTPEQSAEEIVAIADFFESVVWRPLILLLRWPFMLIAAKKDLTHDVHQLSIAGQIGFTFLCMFGFLAQLGIVLFSSLRLLVDTSALATGMWASVAAFAVLTAVRLAVGARVNMKT